MGIPPGVVYIVHHVHHFALPLALVYVGTHIWPIILWEPFPAWLKAPAYLSSFPIVLACSIIYSDFRDRRQAALRGAVLPPRVKSRLPGSIDTLFSMQRDFGKGSIDSPFDQYCYEYGPTFNVRILFNNWFFTMEPEYIKAILSTQFKSFEKGPLLYDQMKSLLGTGVFNSDGEIWKFHRSMTRPFFSKDRISHFDIFEKHCDIAINQVKARLQEGYPVDFQDMAFRLTLDLATEFLFGKNVCSLTAGLAYPKGLPLANDSAFVDSPANAFTRAFAEAQYIAASRCLFGSFWRLAEFWADRIEKDMRVCHKFIDPILKEALDKKRSLSEARKLDGQASTAEREVREGETLLEHLVNYTEDPIVIRDEILNILIAGRDGMASTLTFLIYQLSQHPDVVQRLRAEILDKVGNSRRPTYDDLRDMKYMRAVINETLRLYPPVPFNVRTSVEATVWPGVNGNPPIYIPPHTRISYSMFLIQRRKDLWGPDAAIFDPNRFLDERVKYLIKNPYIFAPFSAGPRICLGQQFAYNQISYFLVRFFQTFASVSLAEEFQTLLPAEWSDKGECNSEEKVIIAHHITLYATDGVWVRMEEVPTSSI